MANTVINTPELLNLDSTTGATVLAKGTVNERPLVQTFSVEYLAVAGGGGGGYQDGGGGGAGGFLTNTLSNINNGQSLALTIGEGGAGGTKTPAVVNSGDSTVITYGSTTITAIGGGGGSSDNNGAGGAANGGSGGGGASGSGTRTGGSGTSGQGNDGGDGNASNQGGGGGGAGAAGQNATSSGANGGIGLTTTIISTTNAATASVGEVSGSNLYFAGGGGGDNRTVFGSGGLGGGSNAAVNPINATANTGGGGGSAFGGSPATGGAGGSGVIILKYDSSVTLTKGSGLTEASGSPFTEGSYKVSVFTQGTGNVTLSKPLNTLDAIDGTLRFNTETNKTEYFDGTDWYEIVDEYASGFIGPATNYFDTKLYTGNGATQGIGGYINGAGSFNGSSSKIDLPSNIVSSIISNGSFTVSAWFKTNITGSRKMIFSSFDSTYIMLEVTTGNQLKGVVSNSAGTNTELTISTTVTDGNWHHALFTGENGNVKLYLDNGTPQTSASWNGTFFNGTGGTDIGSRAGNDYFNGLIDQVRIYNVALSSADVTALSGETAATATTAAFPSGQTAIATYTMDTSANGLLNTQDLSTVNYPAGAGCIALYEMNGNSNDTSGTYNGTPTNIIYGGGAFDQAAVFNGSSSKIDTSLSLDTNNISGGSISFWFNTSQTTPVQILIGSQTAQNGSSYGTSILLGAATGSSPSESISVWDYNGGTTSAFYTEGGSSFYQDGAWHHLVITSTSSTKNIYIDGVSQTISYTGSGSASANLKFTDIQIGATLGYAATYYFDGSIDQVRIFNTALTQAQVTTLARGIATSYSGTAPNVNFNGHLDFAPDFVWIKSRTVGYNHRLFDSVRTLNGRIESNTTAAEVSNTVNDNFVSFDSNGFTLGATSSSDNGSNKSGANFVAWNWKAGSTAVTNNEGTIASQVSANKDSGFSIVKYDGYQSSGTTCGHGLSSAPELIIAKNLNQTTSWPVWYDDAITTTSTTFTLEGSTKYLALNSTTGYIPYTFDRQFGGTLSGSSGDKMIAYCFHSVAGYSKIGSYTGNGSSTGPIVYTTDDGTSSGSNGFEPRWVMIKRTDSTGNWYIVDSIRSTANPRNDRLLANTSNSEVSYTPGNIDFLSNGFQLKGTYNSTNALNGTYIYIAFA